MLYQIFIALLVGMFSSPTADLFQLLEKHGWTPIAQDPALTVAATEVARMFGSSDQVGGPDSAGGHLRFILRKHGISDAHVTPFTVRHGDMREISERFPKLLSRLERRLSPTHLGVGSHHGAQGWTTTVFMVHRGIQLDEALPSRWEPGGTLRITGSVRRGYFRPRILVSSPRHGQVQDAIVQAQDRRFELAVHFAAGAGRYGLEFVADSQYGPVVLHKWSVYVGIEPPVLPLVRVKPPTRAAQVTDPAERLLSLINAHRVGHRLNPLIWNAKLAEVSKSHAEEMKVRRVLAHGSPHSGTLVTRLRSASIPVESVAENLAEASDETAAFKAFLDSPGHARNLLLDPMTHIGIGVAGRYFAVTLVRLQDDGKRPSVNRLETR